MIQSVNLDSTRTRRSVVQISAGDSFSPKYVHTLSFWGVFSAVLILKLQVNCYYNKLAYTSIESAYLFSFFVTIETCGAAQMESFHSKLIQFGPFHRALMISLKVNIKCGLKKLF